MTPLPNCWLYPRTGFHQSQCFEPIKNTFLNEFLSFKFGNTGEKLPRFDLDALALKISNPFLLWTFPLCQESLTFNEKEYIADRNSSNLITSDHALIVNKPFHMYVKKQLIPTLHTELRERDLLLGKLNKYGSDVAFSGGCSIPTSALIQCLCQSNIDCDDIVIFDASFRHAIRPFVRKDGGWAFDHSSEDMGGRVMDWIYQDGDDTPAENLVILEYYDIAQKGKVGDKGEVLVHRINTELCKVNRSSIRLHNVFADPTKEVGNVDFNKKNIRKSMLNKNGIAKKKALVVSPLKIAEVDRLKASTSTDDNNVMQNRRDGIGWDEPSKRESRNWNVTDGFGNTRNSFVEDDPGLQFAEDDDVIDEDDINVNAVSPKWFRVSDLGGLLFTRDNAPFIFEEVDTTSDSTNESPEMGLCRRKAEAIDKALKNGRLTNTKLQRTVTDVFKHCFPSVKMYNWVYHSTRIEKPYSFGGSKVDFTNKALKTVCIDVLKQSGLIDRNSNLPDAIKETFMRLSIGNNLINSVNSTIDLASYFAPKKKKKQRVDDDDDDDDDDEEEDDDVEDDVDDKGLPKRSFNNYNPRKSGCAPMYTDANEYRFEVRFYIANNTVFGAPGAKVRSLEESLLITMMMEHCNALGVEHVRKTSCLFFDGLTLKYLKISQEPH